MQHIVYRHAENHGNQFLVINYAEVRVFGSLYTMHDNSFRPYVEADALHPERAFYYVVNDEATAMKVAEFCASKTPGVDWYWAKISGKVTSKVAPTIVTTFDEKGALPK